MARSYRRVDRDQQFLMPPDMAEWLPADHLVWFVLDVVEQLDTSVFHRRHPRSGPGRAAYDPDMLLALLLYAYAVGERSSRRVESLCRDHVAFRVLCAQDAPDHTTISRFRAVHEGAFADLFAQVLVLCAQAGMGKVGVVSIDGTKIAANASMGANRGEESLRKLAASIVSEAAEVDAAEDAEHGDARGDELPAEWADRTGRKDRIKQALEAIRKQQQEAERADDADRTRAEEYLRRVEAGESLRGNPPSGLDPVRLNKARVARALAQADAAAPKSLARREARRRARTHQRQLEQAEQAVAAGEVDLEGAAAKFRRRRGNTNPIANTTDPDSRKMMSRHGFVQGFNAQIAVSDDHLILATSLSQDSNDNSSFEPMMNAAVAAAATITSDTGNAEIGIVLADAGYFSQHNLTLPGPDRLIAFGKNREVKHEASQHPAAGPPPPDAPAKEQMRHRLRTEQGQRAYKRRSATVETMIAHLKDQVGLRRFSRRGLTAAASELQLAAAVVNLRRLHSLMATA